MARDDFFNRESARVSEALEISLVAQASRTAITLEEFIRVQRLAGLSSAQIETILFDDLLNSGRIFGEFKRALGINTSGKMNELANIAEFAEITDGESETELRWLTTEGDHVCPDCEPRHGEVDTFANWMVRGLPKSGWSVCRHYCQCTLAPADGTELINKVKRKREN